MTNFEKMSREELLYQIKSTKVYIDPLKTLLELSPIPFFIVNNDLTIFDCSIAASCLYGYTKEEILTLSFFDLITKETAEKLPDLFREEHYSKDIVLEVANKKKTGEIFPVKIFTRSVKINGESVKWVVVQDLTEYNKHGGKALTVLQGLSELTDFLPEISEEPKMIVEMDIEGNILTANKLCLEKSGYTNNDLKKGLNIIRLFSPEQREKILKKLNAILKGKKFVGSEYVFLKKDVTTIPVIVSFTPIMTDGIIKGLKGVAVDITEQKRTENDLLILERLRSLGEMSGGVVHDLKNVLTIILGYTQLYLKKCKKTHGIELVKKINHAALDGVEIVKRLQDYSDVRIQQERKYVYMNNLIEEVLELLKPKWYNEARDEGKTISVSKYLNPIPPILANVTEIKEVLSNLILNAVDAINGDGSIIIKTEYKNNFIFLSLSDTGSGMSREVKKRIFEPFFTTKQKTGTGLGMGVTHDIINKLSGEIKVESEEGIGTTITIILPASKKMGFSEKEEAGSQTKIIPLNILVIDDEENICEMLYEFLTDQGHKVRTETNSVEALELLKNNTYKIVITDLNMPGITGWDISLDIKEKSPDTIIIILTGCGEEIDELNKKEKVVDFVLTKPLNFMHLSDIIQQAITIKYQHL
ncbi:MAG: PAS domain S-box protein [Candidatus Latescibacteria bacterium]|jgi:PAS domain S-box-containing protein|nr:PAS domain S-box protein [Candidatus Latescibacterota bacterium]